MKKYIFLLVLSFLFVGIVSAKTITLKAGETCWQFFGSKCSGILGDKNPRTLKVGTVLSDDLLGGFSNPSQTVPDTWTNPVNSTSGTIATLNGTNATFTSVTTTNLGLGATKEAPSTVPTSSEKYANPGFESWIEASLLDSWLSNTGINDAGILEYAVLPTTTVHGGTYAAELTDTFINDKQPSLVIQSFTSLTPGDSYVLKVWTKQGVGSETPTILIQDGTDSDSWWNWNTNQWFDTSAVECTTDCFLSVTTTASWAEQTIPAFTVSSTGSFFLSFVGSSSDIGNSVLLDDATLKKDGTGSNILTDGGFENWTLTKIAPSDWKQIVIDGDRGNFIFSATTSVHSGTYAYEISTAGYGDGSGYFLNQDFGNQTNVAPFTFSTWAKSSGSSVISLVALNDTYADFTKMYDFGTDTWMSSNSSTFKTDVANYASTSTLDGTYTQYTAATTLDTGSAITVGFYFLDGASFNVTLDDTSFVQNSYNGSGAVADLIKILNPSDPDNLSSGDKLLDFRLIGGAGKQLLGMEYDGKITTDFDSFNFNKPIYSAPLTSWLDIDLKTIATYPSTYTVPTGYRLVNAQVIIVTETATDLSGGLVSCIGNNSTNYDNLMDNLTPSMTANGLTLTETQTTAFASSNNPLYLNLKTPDIGTSGTASYYLFGILIPE